MLSFGDIRIYTAGTSTEDITFQDVPNPMRIKPTMTRLLDEQCPQRDDLQMIDDPPQETGDDQLRTQYSDQQDPSNPSIGESTFLKTLEAERSISQPLYHPQSV